MSPAVAIDFGTSRTKLAYYNPITARAELMQLGYHGQSFIPSLFYLGRDDGQILWGNDAEEMLAEDPAGVIEVLKRRLRDSFIRANRRKVTPGELLTLLLGSLRERARKEIAVFDGVPPDKVFLTMPALFGPPDEKILREAAFQAGFTEVELVPEPVAAARAWLCTTVPDDSQEVVVFDCGGGTTDWAYMRRQGNDFILVAECPPGGDRHVGGHDVDLELLQLLKDATNVGEEEIDRRRAHYLEVMRTLKERYCRGLQLRPLKIGGELISLNERDIQAVIETRFISQAAEGLKTYLDKIKYISGDRQLRVLMVGGSARLKGLAEALEARYGCRTTWWELSEYATVLGALAKPMPLPKPQERDVPVVPEVGQSAETDAPEARDRARIDFPSLLKMAEEGDPEAQYILATIYEEGREFKQDYNKAFDWAYKAAHNGSHKAMILLSYYFLEGHGCDKSDHDSKFWFQKGVKIAEILDDDLLKYKIAYIYYNMEDEVNNYEKAFYLFSKLADKNFLDAIFMKGMMFFKGDFVQLSYEKALEYFDKGAKNNHSNSQIMAAMTCILQCDLKYPCDESASNYLLMYMKSNNMGKQEIINYFLNIICPFIAIQNNQLYLYEDIPSDKKRNAQKTFLCKPAFPDIYNILYYDDTFWGAGDDGFLITNKGIIFKRWGFDTMYYNFDDDNFDVYVEDNSLMLNNNIIPSSYLTINQQNIISCLLNTVHNIAVFSEDNETKKMKKQNPDNSKEIDYNKGSEPIRGIDFKKNIEKNESTSKRLADIKKKNKRKMAKASKRKNRQ